MLTAHKIVRARRVLQDASVALGKLDDVDPLEEFRIALVACLTLLRACGHVLNSEADECPALRQANSQAWPSVRSDPIFRDFIEKFRNLVVKEYRAAVRWRSVSQVGQCHGTLKFPILDGQYRGQDFRDVAAQALQWWQAYFDRIESDLLRDGYTLVEPAERTYPELDDDE